MSWTRGPLEARQVQVALFIVPLAARKEALLFHATPTAQGTGRACNHFQVAPPWTRLQSTPEKAAGEKEKGKKKK